MPMAGQKKNRKNTGAEDSINSNPPLLYNMEDLYNIKHPYVLLRDILFYLLRKESDNRRNLFHLQ